MNLVLNPKQKKILLIIAAVLFAGVCLWTWRILFFVKGPAFTESEEVSKEEGLPSLKQNVVFTRLTADTSLDEDVLRYRKKRWEESAAKEVPVEYGPDGKPTKPFIYD